MEALFPFLLALHDCFRLFIRLCMFGDHALELFLELVALVLEFFDGPAQLLGDISREFDAIEAEVCAIE